MDLDVNVQQIDEVIRELEEMEADIEPGEKWFIGTPVEYAVYLEFGTSQMDPKPFFAPAFRRVRQSGQFETLAEETNTVQEYVEEVAKAFRDEVKQVIREKGLIETGRLLFSITAAQGANASVVAQQQVEIEAGDLD